MAQPVWLDPVSAVFVALGVLSAAVTIGSIYRNHQAIKIMNAVWPLTGFYMPILGFWAYRKMSMKRSHIQMSDNKKQRPQWQNSFISTCHCGAGCILGDIIGEFIVFFGSITLFGLHIWASFVIDFILAYFFGIIFQYFSIVPMKHLKPKEGIKEALKADTLSIIAFQVGMYAWMALAFFLLFQPPLEADTTAFWFMMQIAMCIGFLTSYPANWFLVKRGVKTAM